MTTTMNFIKRAICKLLVFVSPKKTEVKPLTLEQALRSGVVELTFIKTNGQLTTKVATRCMDYIPTHKQPKGGSVSNRVLPFYSLGDYDWRSVSLFNGAIVEWKLVNNY